MTIPRILLSNDDGYRAEGLQTLAHEMRKLGEVWIVAPDRERSATSHSISLHKPLRIHCVAPNEFTVDGTPTDCVYMALHHLMSDPPDVVVSGINHGPNLGNDVIYSGTVSAAMEGALFGYSAIAMSMFLPDVAKVPAADREREPWHFSTAASVAAELVTAVLQHPTPPGVLLNVNVPNRPRDEVRGIKLCRLGYTDWSDAVSERQDPRGRPYYWIGGERTGHDTIADSDNNALVAGYVAVTPIHYDLTDYRSFSYVRGLQVGGFQALPDSLGEGPLPHPVHPRLGRGRR